MRIVNVAVPARFRVALVFEDGTQAEVDLGDLAGRGVFTAWDEPGAFESVSIGPGGELVWSCGIELCADALYLRATGKRPEELFPALRREETVA